MKQGIFKISLNEKLVDNVYKMVLVGDTSDITACGQFINIQLDGLYLRRPISVCDCDANTVTIIYKVVGQGTEQMSKMSVGDTLDVLTGLGNGYDLSLSGKKPVLLGGGVFVVLSNMLVARHDRRREKRTARGAAAGSATVTAADDKVIVDETSGTN